MINSLNFLWNNKTKSEILSKDTKSNESIDYKVSNIHNFFLNFSFIDMLSNQGTNPQIDFMITSQGLKPETRASSILDIALDSNYEYKKRGKV